MATPCAQSGVDVGRIAALKARVAALENEASALRHALESKRQAYAASVRAAARAKPLYGWPVSEGLAVLAHDY